MPRQCTFHFVRKQSFTSSIYERDMCLSLSIRVANDVTYTYMFRAVSFLVTLSLYISPSRSKFCKMVLQKIHERSVTVTITETKSRATKNTGNGTANPWFIVFKIIEANRAYIDFVYFHARQIARIRLIDFDIFVRIQRDLCTGVSVKSARLWIFFYLWTVHVHSSARRVTRGMLKFIRYRHFYLALWIL